MSSHFSKQIHLPTNWFGLELSKTSVSFFKLAFFKLKNITVVIRCQNQISNKWLTLILCSNWIWIFVRSVQHFWNLIFIKMQFFIPNYSNASEFYTLSASNRTQMWYFFALFFTRTLPLKLDNFLVIHLEKRDPH